MPLYLGTMLSMALPSWPVEGSRTLEACFDELEGVGDACDVGGGERAKGVGEGVGVVFFQCHIN